MAETLHASSVTMAGVNTGVASHLLRLELSSPLSPITSQEEAMCVTLKERLGWDTTVTYC